MPAVSPNSDVPDSWPFRLRGASAVPRPQRYMIGVFPANIYTVVKHRDEPKARAIALARLPLQIPLVWMSKGIAAGS